MDWIGLAQDRDKGRDFVKVVMNLRVPYNAGKFLSGCTTGDILSRAEVRRVSSLNNVIQLPRKILYLISKSKLFVVRISKH
jgi:hypothetical protein